MLVSNSAVPIALWFNQLFYNSCAKSKWTHFSLQGEFRTGTNDIIFCLATLQYQPILQSNHIILINCGGTLDIVETLEPTEEKVFFIADSHRPYDVCNIYNDGQVGLGMIFFCTAAFLNHKPLSRFVYWESPMKKKKYPPMKTFLEMMMTKK